MPTRRSLHDDAVSELSRYLPSATREDYVRLLLGQGGVDKAANTGNATTEARNQSSFVQRATKPILDLMDGGKFAHEVISGLLAALGNASDEEKRSTVSRFLRFTLTEDGTDVETNTSNALYVLNNSDIWKPGDLTTAPQNAVVRSIQDGFDIDEKDDDPYKVLGSYKGPTKDKPNIAVIEMLNSRVGSAVNDTSGLSIFCSLIPPQIMSRAVPYVSVRFTDPGSATMSSDGATVTPNSLNLIRYLKGRQPFSVSGQGPAAAMIMSITGSAAGTGLGPTPGGMELFTSPQTMVTNLDDISGTAFATAPIDRFRPLMTLKSFSTELMKVGFGILNYKMGSMELTLHDRGRLSEISQLVRPGAYAQTEIEVEYGWSIDPASNSAYSSNSLGGLLKEDKVAQFIDTLRLREKFQIVTSTFRFEDSGQVAISMKLAMKGTFDLRTIEISDEDRTAKKDIETLLEQINLKIQGTGDRAERVFGETLIASITSPEAALGINQEALNSLKASVAAYLKSSNKSEDLTSIANDLDRLFGDTGRAKNYIETEKAKIVKKIAQISSAERPELFPATSIGDGELQPVYTKINPGYEAPPGFFKKEGRLRGHVSLGMVVLHFMAAPLAKTKKYDEIQLVFGKLNERAGVVRNLSLAAFPLDRTKLTEKLSDLYQKNLTITCSQLISVLGELFVNNHTSPAYGFANSYDTDGKLFADPAKGQNVVDSVLKNAGINDLTFILPELSFETQCVPHSDDPTKTILRIVILDKSCNPYQTFTEAINAARTETNAFVDIAGLGAKHPLFETDAPPDLDEATVNKERTELITSMVDKGVLRPVQKTIDAVKAIASGQTPPEYEIDLASLFQAQGWKSTKDYMKESIPTIRYGSSAGMINSIGVSSLTNPAAVNIAIMAMDENANERETSSREKGLPLLVQPTEVQVEMMGCPILNYAQYVFVDFGTNTSLDNIYACVGVSHKVEPGSFTTSTKLIGVGSYGVYTSTVRSLEITKKIIAQYSKDSRGVGAAASGAKPTTETTPVGVIKWSDANVNNGVTVSQLRAAVSSAATEGIVVIGIRVWSKACKAGSGKYVDSTGERVQLISVGEDTSLRDTALRENTNRYCYEIPVIGSPGQSSETLGRNLTINKLQAVKMKKSTEITNSAFSIDLQDYYKEVLELDEPSE